MIRRLPFLASLLITSLGALPLFNSAQADDLTGFASKLDVDPVDAPAPVLDLPLPTRMKLQDEAELKKAHEERRYSFDRPREKPSDRPFIDWERIEPGAYVGFVFFGSAFKADPEALVGLSVRLPIPGLPTGRFAAFAEGFGSYINRNLEFFYPDQAGTWFGGAVGGDFTLYDGPHAYFRARGGILYADFGDVINLKSGMGILIGGELGFYWVQHTDRFRVTIFPEYSFSGSDSMMMLNVGLSFYF